VAEWDIGIQGLSTLGLMAIAFGVVAQLVLSGSSTPWVGLIGGIGYFIGGLLVSEVMFGWATVEDLQPNIDGLSFDEAMLGGLVVGILAAGMTWYLARRTRVHHPVSP
jgi:hypothetical protein